MALFRSRDPAPAAHPITDFWRWWESAGSDLAVAQIEGGSSRKLIDALSTHVRAIHPSLEWEFGKGTIARHRLTVTAAGTAEARPAAERWLRAGPRGDQTWEFRAARMADPAVFRGTLEFAGVPMEMDRLEIEAATDEDRRRIDVVVWHPAFGSLPDGAAMRVAFLTLDWLLGEDDVERWIGLIDATLTRPPRAGTAESLRDDVSALAGRRDPDEWAIGSATTGPRPAVVTYRSWVRWIDHPLFDLRIQAAFPLDMEGDAPTAAALDRLDDIQTDLENSIRGGGIVMARIIAGHLGVIVMYCDSDDQNIQNAATEVGERAGGNVLIKSDPAWRFLRSTTG